MLYTQIYLLKNTNKVTDRERVLSGSGKLYIEYIHAHIYTWYIQIYLSHCVPVHSIYNNKLQLIGKQTLTLKHTVNYHYIWPVTDDIDIVELLIPIVSLYLKKTRYQGCTTYSVNKYERHR